MYINSHFLNSCKTTNPNKYVIKKSIYFLSQRYKIMQGWNHVVNKWHSVINCVLQPKIWYLHVIIQTVPIAGLKQTWTRSHTEHYPCQMTEHEEEMRLLFFLFHSIDSIIQSNMTKRAPLYSISLSIKDSLIFIINE